MKTKIEISELQYGILAKVNKLSDEYNLPVSHTEELSDEDGNSIGVLWNYPHLLMELEILDEDEVIFVFSEKLKENPVQIASFDCVENSERLFKALGVKK